MAIRIEHVGDVAVVFAGGRLIHGDDGIEPSDSTARTEEVQAKLDELLFSGQKKILLNLEKATALGGNALKSLTRFHMAACKRGNRSQAHLTKCGKNM